MNVNLTASSIEISQTNKAQGATILFYVYVQRWEVTTYKYFISTFFKYLYCTWVFTFLTTFPTFEHKYLYFLLHTFSKQARYFSFCLSGCAQDLYQPKMSLFDFILSYFVFWEWDSTINSLDKSYWFYL